MTYNSLLGSKIAYCRKILSFSQKEMAELLSISLSTLLKYEKGIFLPSVKILYDISVITEIPMEAFASDEISLEEFKEKSKKAMPEMFIELHHDIIREFI